VVAVDEYREPREGHILEACLSSDFSRMNRRDAEDAEKTMGCGTSRTTVYGCAEVVPNLELTSFPIPCVLCASAVYFSG